MKTPGSSGGSQKASADDESSKRDRTAAGRDCGVNRWKKDPQKYPDRVILGSETFAADAAVFFDLTKGHPALIGDPRVRHSVLPI